MSKGLAQAIIISAREAFKGAYPGDKITPLGWMQFLLSNTAPRIVSTSKDDGSGYVRDVVIRMMQRSAAGLSVTEDNCSIQTRGAYIDLPVGTTMFRALGITFEDDQIAAFEKDAAAVMNVGSPVTAIMKEVWDVIIANANGLLTDINNDMLGIQAISFGANIANGGSNAAKAINFELDGTVNNLATGMTSVMADAMANEMKLAGSSVVGSGLILNYVLQQQAKSANQSGLDTSRLFIPDFKFDPYAQTKWGVNQFGLFEKDSVAFVNVCRFRGHKAGQKGSDYFFTLKLPVQDSLGQGSFSSFEFDVQLMYRTCPEEVQIGAAGPDNPPVMLGRGWNIILMSSYNQVNIPVNAYQAGDRLYGNNGTYRFTASNT